MIPSCRTIQLAQSKPKTTLKSEKTMHFYQILSECWRIENRIKKAFSSINSNIQLFSIIFFYNLAATDGQLWAFKHCQGRSLKKHTF